MATLARRVRRALKAYQYADCDHPLIVAWADYQYARAHGLPVREVRKRLTNELRLENDVNQVVKGESTNG